MLKKMPLVIFLIVVLSLCYQNCQKPPQSALSNSAMATQNSDSQPEVIAKLDQTEIQNLVFTERMPVQMNHSGKTITLLDLVQFSVNWQSGVVQQLTSQNQLMNQYCLKEDALNALKALLADGKVCQYRQVVAGQMCAQMVVPGYMKFLTSGGEVEVGQQSDSCGTNRTDFCDDRGSSLKEWFTQLKSNLGNLNCN